MTATSTDERASARYPIRLDPRFRIALLLFGVIGRRNAYVSLEDGFVGARFGFFSLRAPLSNVAHWEIGGPYRWWRAIGVRASWRKPEITFSGSAHGGIALFFRRPFRWWWIRRLAVLYLSLDDLEGFAAELTRRGIPGQDVR
ncbi:MAG: hypothetical protein M3N29_04480 [Chloroflexota bacterium]|nr:hypothetical protein [Chloroflexota bacterium]